MPRVRLGHRPRRDGADLARRLRNQRPLPGPHNAEAYERNATLPLLLSDEYFTTEIAKCIPAWRRIVAFAASTGYPVPVFASTLSYYDAVVPSASRPPWSRP